MNTTLNNSYIVLFFRLQQIISNILEFPDLSRNTLFLGDKPPRTTDTIRNMVCCLSRQGKREEAREWLSRLASVAPHHKLIVDCGKLKDAFANFAVA